MCFAGAWCDRKAAIPLHDLREQLPRVGNLGYLEREIAAVTDNFCADPDRRFALSGRRASRFGLAVPAPRMRVNADVVAAADPRLHRAVVRWSVGILQVRGIDAVSRLRENH